MSDDLKWLDGGDPVGVPFKPSAHSELGASISARWMACPGSVNQTRGLENIQTVHAKAGQVAHEIGAKVLLGQAPHAGWFEEDVIDGVVVDAEMVEAVQVYIDYCKALMASADAYGIEEQFDLSALNPPGDMFGTTDFWAYHAYHQILDIVDYKNGSGVLVEVKNNPQLRYYALGAALKLGNQFPIKKVRITIVQPRAMHPDGVVRTEELDYLDLLAFAGELLEAARRTQSPDAPLKAGSHCRFCPASPTCPAQRDNAQALAQVAFADMPVNQPPAPETLPEDVLIDIYQNLDVLENWAASVRAYIAHRGEQGNPLPGTKMVAGKKGNRKWKDPVETEITLRDMGLHDEEMYTQELKSPAKIEKLLSKGQKKILAELVEQAPGRPILVRESDPRPALALAAGDVFQALPPGTE